MNLGIILGLISAVGSVAGSPLTLAGNSNLSVWLRADKGITLGSTLLPSAGGSMTISGTLAQATALHVLIATTGTETTCKLNVSVNGGTSYLTNPADGTQAFTPAQASGALTIIGLSLSLGAATYSIADYHDTRVAQWVDQKNGFVFAQATAAQQPVLNYSRAGGKLSIHLDNTRSTFLSCATAGVAAAFAGTSPAFSLYIGMRSGGAALGVAGIVGVGSTSNAGAFWHMYNNAGWETFSGSGAGAGTITADTRYIVEYFHTGTAETLIASGTTIKNATAQSLNLTSAMDTVVIGGTAIHAVPANFGDQYIDEIAIYNANNHATTSPAVPAYFNARYVDLVSTAIVSASFADTTPRAVVASPPADIPNDRLQSVGRYGRLKYTVPIGCTGVDVTAITQLYLNNGATPVTRYALVWLDGLAQTPLSFTGTLGLRQTQRFTLDGAAHTLEIEEVASIVGVQGVGASVTLVTPIAPNTRILRLGDSITDNYGASTPTNGYSLKVRHALSNTYGTTIWGVIGITLFFYANTSGTAAIYTPLIAAQLDGTAKNIVDIALGTNDWSAGVTAANYLTYVQNIVAAIHAATPSAKICLTKLIKRGGNNTTANAGGSTIANFNTQLDTVQAANSSFVTINDVSAINGDSDGIHPDDTGHASMATTTKATYLTM